MSTALLIAALWLGSEPVDIEPAQKTQEQKAQATKARKLAEATVRAQPRSVLA